MPIELDDLLSQLRKSSKKLEPKMKGDPDITFTRKGGKPEDVEKALKEIHSEEFAQDAKEQRTTYITDAYIGGRRGLSLPENRAGIKKPHYTEELRERTKQSGYVKHLTKEDLLVEQQMERDQANIRRYSNDRDAELVNYVRNTLEENEIRKKEGKKGKTIINFCTIYALQFGTATGITMVDRINKPLKEHGIDFQVEEAQVQNSIDRLFIKFLPNDDGTRWLGKYFDRDDSGKSRMNNLYGFPTDTMQIKTIDLQAGCYTRLPKDHPNYTEEMFLKNIPYLRKKEEKPVITTTSSAPIPDADSDADADSDVDEDPDVKKELATKIHDMEAHRRKREGEFQYRFQNTDDMMKTEFLFGICAINAGKLFSATQMSEVSLEFMEEYPNSRARFKKLYRTDVNKFHHKGQDEKEALSKLVFWEQKTMRSIEMGGIPELALIPAVDRKIIAKGGRAAWSTLREYCNKFPILDQVVNCKSTPECETTEDKSLDGIKREESETLDKEDFLKKVDLKSIFKDSKILTVEDVEDRDSMTRIADSFTHLVDNGIEINFNIGFGRYKKEKEKPVDFSDEIVQSNLKLAESIEKMGEIFSSLLLKSLPKEEE